MLFANVCAGIIGSCYEELWGRRFFWEEGRGGGFGFSSVSCVLGRC